MDLHTINPPMRIDFNLLREQKQALLKMTERALSHEVDALLGIVNIIDAIQDHAVNDLGIDESKVF